MTIKVDKGIEMPPANAGRAPKYPWDQMNVGDSFFVSGKAVTSMTSPCGKAGAKYNAKFSCRTVQENGVKGVRVWRVE